MKTIGAILCISILINQIELVIISSIKSCNDRWTCNGQIFILIQIEDSEPLLQINNARFYVGIYESYLEVEYTYSIYTGAIPLMFRSSNYMYIKLLLSLDNMSFIEVQRNDIDEKQGPTNGTEIFRVSHSFFDPFPFNIEENSILFIKLNSGVYGGISGEWSIYTTPSIALQVPIDIERPWIYSANLTLLFPLLMVVSVLGSVFLVSRRKRIRKTNLSASSISFSY